MLHAIVFSCALFSVTSCFSIAGEVNSFLQPESSLVLEEGSSFEFECTIPTCKNALVTFVRTYKGKSYSISVDLLKQYDDRNISVVYDRSVKKYSLNIDGVVRSDVGVYTCEYVDLASKLQGDCLKFTTLSQIELKVLSPPEITSISSSASSVHEGNPVTLECYASGYPEPIVFWKREDNAKINSAGVTKYPKNVLKIIPAMKKDSGVYQCVAENSVGSEVVKSIKLTVFAKRQLSTEKYEVTEGIYEDEE